MSSDPPNQPARDRPWYQFSLKAMVLATVYFAVLGKVCTVLYAFRLKGSPVWLLVFYFSWTALILARLVFTLWAWWLLRKLSTAAGATARRDLLDDPRAPLESKERRWRFRIALAWGTVPLVLWIAFTAPLGWNEERITIFCIVLLHFLPLMLINSTDYLLRQRRKDYVPLRAMRLCSIAGFMLPALVLLAA
jgi:hypothetical protein